MKDTVLAYGKYIYLYLRLKMAGTSHKVGAVT